MHSDVLPSVRVAISDASIAEWCSQPCSNRSRVQSAMPQVLGVHATMLQSFRGAVSDTPIAQGCNSVVSIMGEGGTERYLHRSIVHGRLQKKLSLVSQLFLGRARLPSQFLGSLCIVRLALVLGVAHGCCQAPTTAEVVGHRMGCPTTPWSRFWSSCEEHRLTSMSVDKHAAGLRKGPFGTCCAM